MVGEARNALRGLAAAPGFFLLCALTLAFGIGANALVFSLVRGILLKPLPYPQSGRLVGLWHTAPGLDLPELPQSDGTYLLYQKEQGVFASLALYRGVQANLSGGDQPERLPAAEVSPAFFQVLRTFPGLGRSFAADDERPGRPPTVILSHGLWQRRFAADPRILTRTVRVDGVERHVVGVMPAGFDFPSRETDLWLPLVVDPGKAQLGAFGAAGIARLAPGVSARQAEARLNQLLAHLEAAFPAAEEAAVLARAGFAARVHDLRDDLVGNTRDLLWLLFGAVGFVLLIACANVANLLILRGEGRRRVQAIQAALGASRGRLLGLVLGESLVLGLAGGLLGGLLAVGGLALLVRLNPPGLPLLERATIDGWVLLFTVGLAVLASLLAGLLPATRTVATDDLAAELRTEGRTMTAGRSHQRTRQLLVGLQVALSVMLLIGSLLFLRSFDRVARVDPGFAVDGVLTLRLSLPAPEYPDDEAAAAFLARAVERLAALPGVQAAGVTSALPLSGNAPATGHLIEDHPREPNAPPPVIEFQFVDPGYFRALELRLLEGRGLTAADQQRRSGAVVVTEPLAKRFWPNQSALGKRLRPEGGMAGAATPWYTVVGVVSGVRTFGLTDEPPEVVFYPLLAQEKGAWTAREVGIAVRGRRAPELLAEPVRQAIWSLDPGLPVSDVAPLQQLVERSRARLMLSAVLFCVATFVALGLGIVGVYGFVSYFVSQRFAEIGMRMAIGAGRADIRWLILRSALALAAAGVVVGLAGAAVLSRSLRAWLFEVSPFDPLTFVAVPLLLTLVVVLASYLPAERAARVDPVALLRR